MTANTETAIKAILAGDSTTTPEQIKDAMAALHGTTEKLPDNADAILTREQVATIMGKSVKSVDIYGRKGIIRRVNLFGGKQASGYSRKSVYEAIERGMAGAAAK